MNTENQKCEVVIFSDRAYQDIKNETYDKDPVETGGLLLGYVLEGGHWVVVEVIPPGNNSTHRYAYLEYDESLAKRVVDQIAGKYEQKLGLLGLWHRHPGSMDFFSGTDDGTNINFAELNPSYGAISGLVNIDPEFRMTMYHVDSPLNYTKVKTCVGDDIIPEELLKLKPGVTIEEIDAIKKTNTRQEHPSASQPSSSSQPQQATPHREEPRRTTQNREHHEKPQVIIQTPDTVTSIFKKLVLEHPKTFFALVVFVGLMGLYSIGSNKETEAEKQQNELRLAEEKTKQAEEERKKQEAEAKKAEEDRKKQEAEAKKAEEDRKKQEAEAKKAEEERKKQEAEAKQAEEARKAEQAKAGAQNKPVTNEAIPEQQGSAEQGGNDKNSEIPDADVAPAKPEEKTEEVGSQPKEQVEQVAVNPPASKETKNTPPAGNGNNNEKECAKLLENDGDFKKAKQYYENELLNHKGGSSYNTHLENLKKVLTKVSNCNEQKQKVHDLINKIDPQTLKQKVEKAYCNQKEACTVLDTINTCKHCNAKWKYKDPIKKWEEKCEKKCSK